MEEKRVAFRQALAEFFTTLDDLPGVLSIVAARTQTVVAEALASPRSEGITSVRDSNNHHHEAHPREMSHDGKLYNRFRRIMTRVEVRSLADESDEAKQMDQLAPKVKERVSVFECESDGSHAILKEFKQLQPKDGPSRSYRERVLRTVRSARLPKLRDCAYTPKLLKSEVVRQDHADECPRGYTCRMLMEKMTGTKLSDVFKEGEKVENRQEILKAFEQTLRSIAGCGIVPEDWDLDNVLWNAEEKKCYMVDLELYSVIEDAAGFKADVELAKWNLTSPEDDLLHPAIS